MLQCQPVDIECTEEMTSCNEMRFLLHQILKPLLGDVFYRRVILPFSSFVDSVFNSSLACGIGYLVVVAAITAYVVVDSIVLADQGLHGCNRTVPLINHLKQHFFCTPWIL